ncbi:hypothetical protein MMC07_006418 [Pseudocyphellaria aurata]|nr:hypothetical protein [Pseudocyphellaria aurata]
MAINKKGLAAARATSSSRDRRGTPANRPLSIPRPPSTRVNRGQHRRNILDDNDEKQLGENDARTARLARLEEAQKEEARLLEEERQAGENDARTARLIEAKEEEARLLEELRQAIQDQEEDEEDEELLTTLARVEELRARQAERAATAHQRTTRLSLFEGPQSRIALGSTPSRQGEKSSPVFVELFERYPAIDEIYLKAIKENTFKPINVVKLTTEMFLDRNEVEAREEDALIGDLEGLYHLIRCFLIYINILVHFTPEPLQNTLWIGMLAYVEQLWSFSDTCTSESVRQYHFIFHSIRIRNGIDDGALWGQVDSNLERRTLRLKSQSEHAAPKSRSGPGTHLCSGLVKHSLKWPPA